ncbi:MAG: DUF1697 domain-containing protein [Rhodococcus sp.]|nr:DUF1697 domain-containing protein [Rhodococcus sp. (in: high G+C Gram-positive bacteria)]
MSVRRTTVGVVTAYVALLRGINVGGINIRMADLAAAFSGLGFREVRTVLASGNVLFTADDEPDTLKATIEEALSARFGYDAYVFVVERTRIAEVVDEYPFDEVDGRHAYAIFVADDATADDLLSAAADLDPDVERVTAGDGVVYWQVVAGSTVGSRFGKRTGAARFKATTTTRNLRTLRKLA